MKVCEKCGEQLPTWKHKFCSTMCQKRNRGRYIIYAKRGVFKGQCTESVNTNHGYFRCPNKGLKHREGMCDECYNWNLRRLDIYPHKDNATRCVELYLVL